MQTPKGQVLWWHAMTSCHWAITRLHQDTQKEPLPTVMGSGRLQGWKALDPLWDSVAEDVRGIGIGRERGNIGIGKEREAFFKKKKKVLFSCILWDCTGTGQRDATQTLCPNWSVLNAWMTFKYAYSPCLSLASSSSLNPQGSLLLIYLWFLDRHGLFWLREESYCDFPSFLAPPKIKQTGYFTALCLQSLCRLAKGAGPQRPVSLLHWALQFLEKTGKAWCVMTSSLLLNCSIQKFGSDLVMELSDEDTRLVYTVLKHNAKE